ncbi:hypothetical protein PybrP1_004952 [[Pythium] brassicae (nom. inval.)]|nr:hypothetical protein PybrP1_004952 [[Pythium] brassicae (nom. inval.)]
METLAHGVAGSVGGMVAMAILYPLDQIKTILQVEAQEAAEDVQKRSFVAQALDIVRTKKWQVYQGHVSTQVALGGSNFVYFFCDVISPLQNLALSCVAGVINVYITAPLWVMNMRLKSKDHANYERMKTAVQLRRVRANPSGGASLSSWEIFVLGALAKSLTTVVTYPLQVAQSLMRVQSAAAAATTQRSRDGAQDASKAAPSPPPPQGLGACLAQIYREQGVAGYFAGLEAKLLQTVLTAAISLVTYEKLFALILALMRHKPRAIEKAAA